MYLSFFNKNIFVKDCKSDWFATTYHHFTSTYLSLHFNNNNAKTFLFCAGKDSYFFFRTPAALCFWEMMRSEGDQFFFDESLLDESFDPEENILDAKPKPKPKAGAACWAIFVVSLAMLFAFVAVQILSAPRTDKDMSGYVYQGAVLDVYDWSQHVFSTVKSKLVNCSAEKNTPLRPCTWEREPYVPNGRLMQAHVSSKLSKPGPGKRNLFLNFLPLFLEEARVDIEKVVMIAARQQSSGNAYKNTLCAAFDALLPRIGLNFIVDALWKVGSSRMYNEAFFHLNTLHILGQFAARKASEEGLPFRMVHEALADTIRFSLKKKPLAEEGYAAVHAATWTELLLQMPAKPDPKTFWDYALTKQCAAYDDLPADTGAAHCIHGIGKAAMFIAARDDSKAARKLLTAGPCDYSPELGYSSSDPEAVLVMTEDMLREGIRLCDGAPSVEYKYVCGSGLYMTFWTSKFKQGAFAPDGSFDYASSCKGMPWSASCYRWTFRYASVSEVEHFRQEQDPCKAAARSKSISDKDVRGCTWGLMTSWFLEAYDDVVVLSGKKYPYLVDYCAEYVELNSTSPKGWYACIGAAMESLAYRSDRKHSEKMVDAFCGYFKDYILSTTMMEASGVAWADRTYELCVQSARETEHRMLFREYKRRERGLLPKPCSVRSDMCMHGWRSDVLE